MTANGKLVRDRIPAIIAADGRCPVVEVLEPADYKEALLHKLVEEASELAAADEANYLGELIDVYEVLKALAAEAGVALGDVIAAAEVKAAERGAFEDRLFLLRVEPQPGCL